MAVITITITESVIQLVAGIPKEVVLSTNVPATIFYTLDGTDPTLSSDIAVGSIVLPTGSNSVVLKAFATDGTDTSAIVTQTYAPNIVGDRKARDKVVGLYSQSLPSGDSAQFGDPSPNPDVRYDGIGGITVDAPDVEGTPIGYDGTATGTYVAETDRPWHRSAPTGYDIHYSDKTETESGPGVGTLPAEVTVVVPSQSNNSPDANSKLFDPHAMVIIQDGREEPEDPNVSLVNRQFFSLGNPEKVRDGIGYNTTGLEGSVPTGSFIKPQYNPRENTYTFYYRDAETNRWIISIEPIRQATNARAVSQWLLPSSSFAEHKVFKWMPFKRQILR